MDLVRLLTRAALRPYLGAILAVIVMQALTTAATLYLPSLNARIIDEGVAQGDVPSFGALVLSCSLWLLCRSFLPVLRCGSVHARQWGSAATSGARLFTASRVFLPKTWAVSAWHFDQSR